MYKNTTSESILAKFPFFKNFMSVGWFLSKYVSHQLINFPELGQFMPEVRCKHPPFDLEEMFSMTALALIV